MENNDYCTRAIKCRGHYCYFRPCIPLSWAYTLTQRATQLDTSLVHRYITMLHLYVSHALYYTAILLSRNHSGHSIMPGNSNTYVANVNDLSPPIVASKVRFVPHSAHKRTVRFSDILGIFLPIFFFFHQIVNISKIN